MEPGLPVWTIRPNWAQGITERLEWLTDVIMADTSGDEQRIARRISPRRYMEMTVNPVRRERSYLDLLLHSVGSAQWLVPLWFDKAATSASIDVGALRVPFDTSYREHGLGGYALLYYSAFRWEVVSISDSDATGLDLIDPIEQPWPEGTTVYPLRKAILPLETSLSSITSRVGESVLLWQTVEANDYPEVIPDDSLFEGLPVLTTPPNRSQEITLGHLRLSTDLDNQVGLPYRVDPVGRAFQVQSHNWLVQGRQAHAEFRSFLYWLRGRQRSLWLPSFNDDVIAARASNSGSLNLDVEEIGMGYSGGVVPGRDVLWLNGAGARVTAMGVAQDLDQERLRIGAGLSGAVAVGDTGAFMEMSRLNQDSIELTHHTDTDGVMEIGATFQSFANNRDASGTIYTPIPTTNKTAGRCGRWTARAIVFVLDKSNSMNQVVAPGLTRLQSMKQSMAEVFANLKPYSLAYDMDVAVVGFSSGTTQSVRRSALPADLDSLTTFTNNIATDGGGTYFASGMTAAKNILDATDDSKPDHFIFFITDGEPSSSATVTAAVNTLNSMVPTPLSRGINIDLTNTTETQKIDNTGTPVPVVIGADYTTLVDAVMSTF